MKEKEPNPIMQELLNFLYKLQENKLILQIIITIILNLIIWDLIRFKWENLKKLTKEEYAKELKRYV